MEMTEARAPAKRPATKPKLRHRPTTPLHVYVAGGADGRDTGLDNDFGDGGVSETPSEDHERQPAVVQALLNLNLDIVQVAVTDHATFALTSNGRVWGVHQQGDDGVIGFLKDLIEHKAKVHPDELIARAPTPVPGLKDIQEIATGCNHVLALTRTGNVYAWGSGHHGELGRRLVYRHRFESLTPAPYPSPRTPYVEEGSVENLHISHPVEVKTLEGIDVRLMAGGLHHSIACTGDGRVLVWGRCDDSQMGASLAKIPDLKAVFIAAGTDNCFVADPEGNMYSWGFSEDFRTGLGTEESIKAPTRISDGEMPAHTPKFAASRGSFTVFTSGTILQADLGSSRSSVT
ncbi:unnamed protein product [Parascedosporium putredinis]|uniref:Uncharacterized protein n=1 Tax=Parascedosporium putredinis TaxID=1442378 RepID=A0A9P1H709_9PEZI|nr:unnamed protein product [Parascedosporium putredinis]CAI8000960.1 unnamed protein product [Parascedosporium putredinis]